MSTQKLAVVTGASSGIGRATALDLARAGWRVVVVARNEQALQKLAAETEPLPGEVIVEPLDASDGEAVVAMGKRVTEAYGTPDTVVNSAGAGQWKFIEDTTPAESVQMMGAPYFAAFNVSHAFMPGMLERRSGSLIHINSPVALFTWAGATGYAATRWALRGLHQALHQDLRGTGVRSVHVVFGEVTSDYFDNNPGSHERLPAIAKLIPRLSPEYCARKVMKLIRRPRRLAIHPFILKLMYWNGVATPWLFRWVLGLTGHKHPR